jgi:hypothetical protein
MPDAVGQIRSRETANAVCRNRLLQRIDKNLTLALEKRKGKRGVAEELSLAVARGTRDWRR